ncbi:urokinase plasminogen activator surface receptor isoform X2 [Rhincodon typus]|uniref:urokinase plasminogen activator surface receptor isoform X2 n=1 Tax=Rhincodon typus TaxID=259920 RepID=UPI00202E4D84|nr:urokinase plasminogen activator surface receptor isoform X2 [Rhincodon typus]
MLQRSQTILYPTVLLCSLLAEVRPLTCHQCSSTSGECSLQQVTCLSGINTCQTTSISIILAGKPNQVIRNSCGSCWDPVSLNTGSVILSESSRCCDFNLCNDQTVAEARNSTRNGLECRGCFSNSSESCRLSEQTVQCTGAETRCMNVSGIQAVVSTRQQFFAKGCVSKRVCQSFGRLSDIRIQFDDAPKCCSSDLCNGDLGGGTSTRKPGWVIAVTFGVIIGVLILLLICYFHCRKKQDSGPL